MQGWEELFTIYVHTNPDFKPPLADQDPTYSRLFAENLIPSEPVRAQSCPGKASQGVAVHGPKQIVKTKIVIREEKKW